MCISHQKATLARQRKITGFNLIRSEDFPLCKFFPGQGRVVVSALGPGPLFRIPVSTFYAL